ncbi:PepSY domain-containing protein [Rhizobium sp. C1]|uniref:PepSY domain-containing protein n=1 Tax=Rhizobium sp. C1 TaxID=1349799 RepID=UPI001E63B999|nr:PepSY domain-containing protein [Rhizobium sp. C1]MCD2179892.1 PepSY domain-containing protein [Rhizobium sp. C1]
MRHPVPVLLSVILALALGGMQALADGDRDSDDDDTLNAIHRAVEAGEIKPLSDLKAIVSRRFPGDIVRIEPHLKHGSFTYEFKVLQSDGRLVEIDMDAATGRVLKTENE